MNLNPGASLFQGSDLKINNSQNNEEDEYLEDQIRHKEELKNLLTNELDDFKYEDSTINSSTNNSLLSQTDLRHYQNAVNSEDQMKILYDCRVEELQDLKAQIENFRTEVQNLRSNLFVKENEIRELKISLKNSEALLIEKSEQLSLLQKQLSEKDEYILKQNENIEKLETDVCIYKSENNELQIKLTDFNGFQKQFQIDEIQKANSEHVLKLEALLSEQNKKADHLEKENLNLRNEVAKLVELNNEREMENKHTVNTLIKNFDAAQQQCKDLVDVVEALTRENEHLKGRIENNIYLKIDLENESLDKLQDQCEKLRQMLLDKSVEINTLNKKLVNYDENLKELLTFRQLKNDIYKEDFQECDNILHMKNLLVMQHELNTLQNVINDRDKQISNLSSINRELQEKIEEMLQQTRNDIQNLSEKYSVPQLEIMSEELRLAHEQIIALKEELERKSKNSDDAILKQQLQITQQQIMQMQKYSDSEKSNFEELIRILQKNLDRAEKESLEYREQYEELKKKFTQMDIKNDIYNDSFSKTTSKKTKDFNKIENLTTIRHLKLLTEIRAEILSMINLIKDDLVEKATISEKMQDWYKRLDETHLIVDENNISEIIITNEEKVKMQQMENELSNLKECLEEASNAKILMDGEKCNLLTEIENLQDLLSQKSRDTEKLIANEMKYKSELKELENELEEYKSKLINLENKLLRVESELKENETKNIEKENYLQIIQREKISLSDMLEQTRNELENTKKEMIKLQKDLQSFEEENVKKCLENQLKIVEKSLAESDLENTQVFNDDNFKKCLQTETLKIEINLRDEINAEFSEKMSNLENKYKKLLLQNTEFHQKELNNMKHFQTEHRLQMGQLLSQCGAKISELESENMDLLKKLKEINLEYQQFKKDSIENQEKYNKLFEQINLKAEMNVEAWKKWTREFITKTLNVEAINRKSRENIFKTLKSSDEKVKDIERQFMIKVKKYVKEETKKLKEYREHS